LIWYFLAYTPTQAETTRQLDDAARLRAIVERAERARDRLPEVQALIADLERDREAFLADMPTASEVADLVTLIREAAARSGVEVQSVSQGSSSDAVDVEDVRTLAFFIGTQGRYAATMRFLGELETLERYARIDEVGLDRDGEEDDPGLNGSFRVTVFVYVGEDPGARAEVRP